MEDPVEIPVYGRTGVVAVTLVDADRADEVAGHRWHRNGYGYACRSVYTPRGMVLLHRWLLGMEKGDGLEVDHINRDRLDNRLENLREATRAENAQNRPKVGTSSRFRGVSFVSTRPRPAKWTAHVRLAGRNHNLGYYLTEEEAGAVALAFRQEHMPFATD